MINVFSTFAAGRRNKLLYPTVIVSAIAIAAATLAACGGQANAQSTSEPAPPLILKSTGSFFTGGRTVTQSDAQINLYAGGTLPVDQMYVQYMVPQAAPSPSVVMVHGGILAGTSYETTPDGRMGWYEYFARKGYPSYVVDQVNRGRSGFNQAPFNDVRAGAQPPASQPGFRRIADGVAWTRFRFGPSAGVKFEGTQFPVEAAGEFAKQGVPDFVQTASPDPNYTALSQLAQKLADTILLGHSQSGRFPFEAALLNPKGIRSMIAVEPPGCNAAVYSDEQISKLAKFPILIVFGDYLDMRQTYGPDWLPFFKDCQAFVDRVNAAKGNAKMLHPPSLGIRGNSHMIMQDKNNLVIADLIIDWIKQH